MLSWCSPAPSMAMDGSAQLTRPHSPHPALLVAVGHCAAVQHVHTPAGRAPQASRVSGCPLPGCLPGRHLCCTHLCHSPLLCVQGGVSASNAQSLCSRHLFPAGLPSSSWRPRSASRSRSCLWWTAAAAPPTPTRTCALWLDALSVACLRGCSTRWQGSAHVESCLLCCAVCRCARGGTILSSSVFLPANCPGALLLPPAGTALAPTSASACTTL